MYELILFRCLEGEMEEVGSKRRNIRENTRGFSLMYMGRGRVRDCVGVWENETCRKDDLRFNS